MSDHESFPDFEAQQPTGGHNIPFREIARRFSAAPYVSHIMEWIATY